MKRIAIVVVLAAASVLSGCGVQMNAQYRQELDEQVVLAKVTAKAATAGNLTPEDAAWTLRSIYVLMRTWQDAQSLKGVPSEDHERALYIDGLYGELE